MRALARAPPGAVVDVAWGAGRRQAAYEVLGAAIPIRVAIENERAARAMAKWARVATFSSVASVVVAIAAVIVAAVA